MRVSLRRSSALCLSFVLLATTAYADEKQDAREAFGAGVSAFQKGDYQAALERFREADAAHHSPAITYNIARTLEKLEKAHDAVAAYESYIVEAGEAGEFTSAATVAIAQIKATSSRLRIESTPPGARVSLDGEWLADRTPVTVLVSRGSHQIQLSAEGWTETRAFDAPGGGGTSQLVFVRSQPAKVSAPPPAPKPKVEPVRVAPPPKKRPEISGLVGTAGLSLSLYRFVGSAEERAGEGKTTADSAPAGLVFGLAFDVGFALSTKTALLLRGFGGLGSAEQSLATLGAGGPVIAIRLSDRWWFGGGIVLGAGRADSDATQRGLIEADSEVTFETDLALGPTLELSYVLDQNEDGHWTASLLPSTLFTTSAEESTLFVPLMLGYRWF